MKALVLESIDKSKSLQEMLVYKDVDTPQPKENEVLINLKYASLNHRDLFITKGLYANIKTPVILGSDGAGVIEDANGSEFNANDDVIINPTIDWGNNENFQNKNFRILGMPDNGTLAEYICIDKKYVHKKPEHLDLKEAAALPLAGLTAYRACIVKANIQPEENVLITGIGGGVSTFAFLYATALGANVYITSGSGDKINFALSRGAKCGINYREDDWEKKIKKHSEGIDVVIDSAGGETFSKCLDLCNEGARLVSYGATFGAVEKFEMRKVFWKQLNIMGTTMGSYKDFENMVKFISENEITPFIDKEYDLENGADAFERMESGDQIGKIIVKI